MSMISELVKELRWIAEHEYQSRNSEDTIRRAAETIEMLSEKVREPKQGEWIYHRPPDDWIMSLYSCSECDHIEEGKPNFCPNCGARMNSSEKPNNCETCRHKHDGTIGYCKTCGESNYEPKDEPQERSE